MRPSFSDAMTDNKRTDSRTQELQQLLQRLDLDGVDIEIADRALTHASNAPEEKGIRFDYESLEFLGDAVLGLVVAEYLFEACPEHTPGEYSRMRAGLVNRRKLAELAKAIDLGPAIRLGRSEEKAGGRKRSALLADCFEALIGAVHLSKGIDAARKFIVTTMEDDLARVVDEGVVWDYKSRLQHFCQAERLDLPEFIVVQEEGPDHLKHFEVEVQVAGKGAGRGGGRSKKEAEQAAARSALEQHGQLH